MLELTRKYVQYKEATGNAREKKKKTVFARMEQYLNASDCMTLEIEVLELPLGPEDSEVNLRKILRNASRRAAGYLKSSVRRERKIEHLVASNVRWDERQRQKVASKKVRARS